MNIYFSEMLLYVWTLYLIVFLVALILSLPIFIIFYFLYEPLKLRKNIDMHKKELKTIINIMCCLFIFLDYGINSSLLYSIFLKVLHDFRERKNRM